MDEDDIPSVVIGRFGLVPIRVDATFVIVPVAILLSMRWPLIAWPDVVLDVARGLALLIAVSLGVLGSLLVHEVGHAAAARCFGMNTREIRIGGFYGLAIIEGDSIEVTGAPAVPRS